MLWVLILINCPEPEYNIFELIKPLPKPKDIG
jgi:hypothetical protein